jgi:hypothetical protein
MIATPHPDQPMWWSRSDSGRFGAAQIEATRELIAINGKIVQILKYQRCQGLCEPAGRGRAGIPAGAGAATLPPLVKQPPSSATSWPCCRPLSKPGAG